MSTLVVCMDGCVHVCIHVCEVAFIEYARMHNHITTHCKIKRYSRMGILSRGEEVLQCQTEHYKSTGPMCTKLPSFGRIHGLACGAFGKGSQDVYNICMKIAGKGGATHYQDLFAKGLLPRRKQDLDPQGTLQIHR